MNTIKIFISTILGICLLSGCAYFNAHKDSHQIKNPKIVYRDLTQPLPTEEEYLAPGPQVSLNKPKYFIAFENESVDRFDTKTLDKFMSETDIKDNIIIFGHSHGNSGKGTLTLSSGRARAIRDILSKKGYENVFVMAFWGKESVEFAPIKGVQLYVLPPDNPNEIVLTITKNEEAKDDEIDPTKSYGRNNNSGGSLAGVFE